jgi:transketolase
LEFGVNVINLKRFRKEILELACEMREGHIPSAFSILEIISVLYFDILDVDAIKQQSENRDRLILSKGHGSLALYVILRECGLVTRTELENFCKFRGPLGGHPHRSVKNGIEASTGSLGHGFPIAVGLAISLRQRSSKARIIALVGDGECNEGSIWEAALLAKHHSLTNLMCVVDFNHSGDRALSLGDLFQKFEAFGFNVKNVNGHDTDELRTVLGSHDLNRPTAVIANTVKGFGIKSMENNPAWHHAFPTQLELQQLLTELN